MSIHHRADGEELADTSLWELYNVLGERDTAWLFDQKYKIDTEHDCPTGGGNTIDRKTKLIDCILYQQVMDNEFKASGLTRGQIINAWLQHEHVEICIIDGDNPIDTQPPAHDRALAREHEFVRFCGAKVPTYENAIWPGLVDCYNRPVKKPHPQYWCGPLLSDPTDRDEEILKELRRLGVTDAFKRSKYEVHYGIGEYACADCKHWHPQFMKQKIGFGELAGCEIATGLVRDNRHCDHWTEAHGRSDDHKGS
jgi:hypothetical protein